MASNHSWNRFCQICLLISLIILPLAVLSKVNIRTYIPEKAKDILPILFQEVERIYPEHPMPAYFGALGEVESCISLTHSLLYYMGVIVVVILW